MSEEFRSFFEQFGPVMESIVLVDKATNRSRGFGFVTFENVCTAKKLLAIGHREGSCPPNPTTGRLKMQGKTIEVKTAQPKESSRRFIPTVNRYDPRLAPPVTLAGDPCVIPVPPTHDFAYSPQPYYPSPGAVFAGYYRIPGYPEMDVVTVGIPLAQPPVMMEGYAPAYFFSPYGVPTMIPQASVLPPEYPDIMGKEDGIDHDNTA
jgi:hypothetical protein